MSRRSKISEDEANKLANRLVKRLSGEKETKKERLRLGDRLGRDDKESESGSSVEENKKVSDFFNEFEKLTGRYPELKNVKVSQLKQVISQVGMKHPKEVADMLRESEYKSELREMKDKWITH